jgi:type I restriction enzyme S subunit
MEMLDIEVFEGGFKETELGPLPEEWEVVRVGEVIKYYTPSKKLKQSDYKTFGKFPVIDQGQKYIAGFYDDETMIFDKDLPVILFGDHTRIIKYVDFPFICGAEGLKIIVPKENFHRKYFYYALLNLNIPSRGYNRHFTILREKSIPLPPLEEQKAIAGILSTVQSAIEKTEKVINALKNLKKSMMKHLFTYGPVAEEEAEKVELKETEIGLISKHWEVVRVGEVIKYYTPSKKLKQSDYKTFGKFPVIDQGQKYIAGFYDDETMIFDKDLPVILFGDHTRIIKYVDFPFICGAEGLKIIVPKENFHRKYFYYALLNLNIPSRGYNRHFTILREKLIPLPPLEEQQKIAQILQSIDQRIEKEEKYKNALQNLFKSLLHNLMTGKIRVRVKEHGED